MAVLLISAHIAARREKPCHGIETIFWWRVYVKSNVLHACRRWRYRKNVNVEMMRRMCWKSKPHWSTLASTRGVVHGDCSGREDCPRDCGTM
jgi:hypothetical protein